MLFVDMPAPVGQTTIPLRTAATSSRYGRSKISLTEDFVGRRLRLRHYGYTSATLNDNRYFILKVFVNGVVATHETACIRDSVTGTTSVLHTDSIVLPCKNPDDPVEETSPVRINGASVGNDWGVIELPQTTKQRSVEFEIWGDPTTSTSVLFSSFLLWFDVEK
jgi:hypothetical protein